MRSAAVLMSVTVRAAAGMLCVLVACVALVPMFRAGVATVQGYGSDAHMAAGTAQLLRDHPPTFRWGGRSMIEDRVMPSRIVPDSSGVTMLPSSWTK